LLEIDGISQAGFSEVTLPDASGDTIEYREGENVTAAHKIPELRKHPNIVLKRGLTNSSDLCKWFKNTGDRGHKSLRRNISLVLLDEVGNEAARWNFVQAWPTKYDPPDLSAKGGKGNTIAIETLEIAYEGSLREK